MTEIESTRPKGRRNAMNPIVERVHTATGSHIEPPLDDSWTDVEKLRWHAAVVECDTGVRIEVRDDGSLGGPGWGLSQTNFNATLDVLTGIAIGAREARKQLQ